MTSSLVWGYFSSLIGLQYAVCMLVCLRSNCEDKGLFSQNQGPHCIKVGVLAGVPGGIIQVFL